MGERLRLLLVEDNPVDRMAFERHVQRENLPYVLQVATSIDEARHLLATEQLDLVLMDYTLADGTAFDLLEAAGDLPSLILAGSGDEGIAVEAIKRGVSDYLVKDLEANYLVTLPLVIEKSLDRWHAQRELNHYRAHLEEMVSERTAEVVAKSKELQAEVDRRQQAEASLRQSLDETARSQRMLLALSQAAQDVQQARSPEAVYRVIAEQAVRLGLDAVVFELSEDRQHLVVAHHTIKSLLLRAAERLAGLSAQDYRFHLRPGGFFQQLLARGESQFSSKLRTEPVAEALPGRLAPLAKRLTELFGWQQLVYAPLTVSGQAWGLLVFAGTGLSEADVPAVATFANQAAIAADNARLYRETEHLATFNQSLVQSMAEGIAVEDVEGVLTFVNPAAAEMLGYTPDELVGLHRTAFIPPDHRSLVDAQDALRVQGKTSRYESQLLRRDGERVAVLVAGSPLFDENGEFAGTMAVFTNITERKRIEESLRASERQMDLILNSTTELVAYYDTELRVIWANRSSAESVGKSPEDLVGMHCYEIWYQAQEPCDNCPVVRARDTGKPQQAEQQTPDGRYWSVRGYPVLDDAGQVVGLVEFGQDITATKQAKEALQDSEARLREAQGVAQIGNWKYLVQSGELDWSDELYRIYGLDPNEIVVSLDDGLNRIHPDDQTRANAAFDRALQEGQPYEIDYRIIRPDGQERVVQGIGRVERNEAGEIIAVYGTGQDITERKRAEEEIRKRNRELALLNRVIAATAIGNEAQTALETVCRELALAFQVPQAAAALFDDERSEAVVVAEYVTSGRTLSLGERIPMTGSPGMEHLLTKMSPFIIADAQSGTRQAPIQDVFRQRGANSLLLVPLIVQGEVVGSLGLETAEPRAFTDDEVTLARRVAEQVSGVLARARLEDERRQLEEQFYQAQKMEAVGRLAGGIAHDFNNLMTVIHLSSRLLERRLVPEDPLRPHVLRIQEAGKRATNLTRQLLAFSRREMIEPQVVDLNQLLGDLERMLQRLISEDVVLTMNLMADLWAVKIDPTQVEQVVVNLAVNSRDALPGGGELTIETQNVVLDATYADQYLEVDPGEYAVLLVTDNGAGMDDEVKSHLFEPFYTTKERGKGTGLGLATVFGIVKQNGGHIGVDSQVGVGTTFKIYLPRYTEELPSPVTDGDHEPTDGDQEPTRGSETLLLVEDEEAVRELTRDILMAQGYDVLTAEDGIDALHVAQAHKAPIHILVTDVVMPRMSGRALADQLKATHHDMRVLYISGYTDDAIVHHGVLDEAVHFLSKPFEVEELARKVRDVLDGVS